MQVGIDDPIQTTPAEPPASLRAADPTLAALAERAAAGDDEAFNVIYRRLAGGLRRFLTRRGGATPAEIEELAQLTWVDVWQALRAGRYDPVRAALTTFVYAVAYKVWLQHRRQVRAALPQEGNGSLLHSFPATNGALPADALHLAEQIQIIRSCLSSDTAAAGLSADERTVVLGLVDGESERALAARLSIAASTVHARKSSAFQKIREHMDLHSGGGGAAERRAAVDR